MLPHWIALMACKPAAPPDGPGLDAPPPQSDTSEPCEPGVDLGVAVPETLMHDGQERTTLLYVPEDYDCTPRPLVIGLHGYYGSGRGFATQTANLGRELAELGWIGLFPDGLPAGTAGYPAGVTSFNDLTSRNDDGPDGPTCTDDAFDYVAYDNCGPEEADRACRWGTSCADDAGFLRALLEDASTRFTVDQTQVVLTGFSQGGQAAQGLACDLADVVTMVAPIHGFAANGHTCAPDTPLTLFQVAGRADRVVNAFDTASADGMIYDGAAEAAALWAMAQGCELEPVPKPSVSDGVRGWGCEEHPSCATGAQVVTCTWDGGHVWGTDPAAGNFTWSALTEVAALLQ